MAIVTVPAESRKITDPADGSVTAVELIVSVPERVLMPPPLLTVIVLLGAYVPVAAVAVKNTRYPHLFTVTAEP